MAFVAGGFVDNRNSNYYYCCVSISFNSKTVIDIFYILIIDLLVATAIFYVVLFSFIYYWHLKKISFVVVPMIFTFEFFAVGFLIVSIITLAVKYLPVIISLWQ